MNGMFNSTVVNLYLQKQLLLDLANLLAGNVTSALIATIDLLESIAGVLYDIERILEKVIVLLQS